MDELVVAGGKRLAGNVVVDGSKNAAVAVVPAALLSRGVCVIENLPLIDDIFSLVDVLTKMGVVCEFIDKNTLKLDSSGLVNVCANFESVKKIRASYYLVGVLLAIFDEAGVSLPGGCNLGSRPFDLHQKGFEALGAKVQIEHGIINVKADKLVGRNVYLDIASVGATINIMLAAVHAEGVTTIENSAKEPHVVDVANFLNAMGASVKGAGTDEIKIYGVQRGSLQGRTYAVIPDQIEAGTFMLAAAATGGDVVVENVIPKHMDSVSAKLREMGCLVEEYDDSIRVAAPKQLKQVNVKTMFYPGFPTDLQPQMCALLACADGTGIITEAVHENRFQYINELKRLGANVTVDGRVAIVKGPARLTGAEVSATDLRAGAALVIGGLAALGDTTIGNVKYIDRGYAHIDEKLNDLGAHISRRRKKEE